MPKFYITTAIDYANGDPKSLNEIVTSHDPATFFSPDGQWQEGAGTIAASYRAGTEHFQAGGHSRLEILQSKASGDLAFWTGLQHADVKMAKTGEVVPMTLRITEVFRYEQGVPKLVHRHADQADAKQTKKPSPQK